MGIVFVLLRCITLWRRWETGARAPAETGPLNSNRLPRLWGVFAEMERPRRQSHFGGFAGLMIVIQQLQGGLQSIWGLPVAGEGCAQLRHWVSLGL